MEGKLIATADTLKNWEGVLVSLYEYKDETGHLARVWLADADAKKIATWVITTCFTITGKCDYKNSMLLITEINKASNGQFPVLGVVFEDGTPYIFKDGITVHVNTPLTDYTDLSLVNETNINKTMKYGRIISTTREEYNALFPDVNTTDHHWREVVRMEYKKALAADENNLIIAWAKGKLQGSEP
ncbi:MAG: hypothetical protein QM726_09970 [Chitinophagaceae bacterium]